MNNIVVGHQNNTKLPWWPLNHLSVYIYICVGMMKMKMMMIMGFKKEEEMTLMTTLSLSILSLYRIDDINDVRNSLFLALRMEVQLRNLENVKRVKCTPL